MFTDLNAFFHGRARLFEVEAGKVFHAARRPDGVVETPTAISVTNDNVFVASVLNNGSSPNGIEGRIAAYL